MTRGHVVETPASGRRRATTMGRSRGEEQHSFQVAQVAQALARGQVPDHEGKGFGHPAFAFPEGGDGLVIAGVGGQVKAAEALDGHDPAMVQPVRGRGDGVPVQAPVPFFQPDPGATDGAGGGFGMKAPVFGGSRIPPGTGAQAERPWWCGGGHRAPPG